MAEGRNGRRVKMNMLLLLSYPLTFLHLFRSESDLQAIDIFIDADLAAEAAVVSGGVQDIQHFFFLG